MWQPDELESGRQGRVERGAGTLSQFTNCFIHGQLQAVPRILFKLKLCNRKLNSLGLILQVFKRQTYASVNVYIHKPNAFALQVCLEIRQHTINQINRHFSGVNGRLPIYSNWQMGEDYSFRAKHGSSPKSVLCTQKNE